MLKFADYLSKQDIQKLNQLRMTTIKKEAQKRKKKQNENLSHKEWEEIMGKNRDRFVRVRGAFRRK